MKLLITGAGGQLGRDLTRVLSPEHELSAMDRKALDVTDEEAVREAVDRLRPDAIVHSAAYTNVDQAEGDAWSAYRVNAHSAWNLAVAAHKTGAKLVYVSTDYVFDGRKGSPYAETDKPNPLNVYGSSKLLGEQITKAICARHYIVRTSWLYGKHGNNFVTKVAAKALQERKLTLVNDQFGSPTYTFDLAEWIGRLLETEHYGIYHASNRGWCSRYEFGLEIVKALGLSGIEIKTVSVNDLKETASRPQHSAFADREAQLRGLPRLRDWRSALHDFIRNDYEAKGDSYAH
ncbi:dTDP-4-dehydrorhamnose reductase [Paenibacillus chartarius]|uniref:dTDP-4-dehydrorhamnose reductase n=1 Tax=Paenibacillus chartarius TaxID=747481 RepID=A0ABV6DIE8_9BACL